MRFTEVFVSRESGTECRELLRDGEFIFCMRNFNSFPKKLIIDSSTGGGRHSGSVHAVTLWFRTGTSKYSSCAPKRKNKREQTRQHWLDNPITLSTDYITEYYQVNTQLVY